MDNNELKEIKHLILFTSIYGMGITSFWNMANYFDNVKNEEIIIYENKHFGIINVKITTKIFFEMAIFTTIGTTMYLMTKIC